MVLQTVVLDLAASQRRAVANLQAQDLVSL